MEKSFDLGAVLRNNQLKHKSKPAQFVSVAHGVQKRLEANIKNRRSSRLTLFDHRRNFTARESPIKKSEVQLKLEHRKQQLEKWKEEKAQKKKELAAQKKKPFLVGSAPMKFLGPPPVVKPSTSGRVTRSQAAKSNNNDKESPKQRNTKSFAPKNATFRPPEIRNTYGTGKIPTLAPVTRATKSSTKKINALTFNPVLPNTAAKSVKQTRSKTLLNRQTVTEVKKPVKPLDTRSVKSKVFNKPPPKSNRITKPMIFQSSSSGSDVEPIKKSSRFTQTSIEDKNRKSSGSTKTIAYQISSGRVSSAKSKRASKTVVYDLTSPEEEPKATKTIKRIQTPGPSRVLQRKTEHATPKTFSLSTGSEESSSDISLESSGNPGLIVTASGSVEVTEKIVSTVNEKTPRKSLLSTPHMAVPRSESASEQKLRSPKSPLTPEQMDLARKISPCVTLSRGKDNARKEMKWKMNEGLLDGDSSDVENVELFRVQLDSEVTRMTEMCATWEKISDQTLLPEAAQEEVRAGVGQARLLMAKKLQQFRELVERCARPEPGATLVTPADLQGFWDMVYMQIENVEMRFKKLEELRARGWAAPADRPPARPAARAARAARAAGGPGRGRRPAPAPSERLREVIAAARRAKLDGTREPAAVAPEKTFEAGFFRVQSPVRSPRPASATPRASALRRAVVSSEASKNASFAMLRASLLGKYDGVAQLELTPVVTPINLDATPGRSILKSAKSANKSIKTVLFKSDADSSFTSAVSDQDKAVLSSGDSTIDGVEEFEKQGHADSFVSAMGESVDVRKHVLLRQDAVDLVTPKTGNMHKNHTQGEIEKDTHNVKDVATPGTSTAGKDIDEGTVTKKRRGRKKIKSQSEEAGDDVELKVTRNKKSSGNKRATDAVEDKTPSARNTRSSKNTVGQNEEANVIQNDSGEEIEEAVNAVEQTTSSRRKPRSTKKVTQKKEEIVEDDSDQKSIQNKSPTRNTSSAKETVKQKEQVIIQNDSEEETNEAVNATPSRRKSRSTKASVAQKKEENTEDDSDLKGLQKEPPTRNRRSRRLTVIENKNEVNVLEVGLVRNIDVNDGERDMIEVKTASTRRMATRKSVLQEVQVNVIEDLTPRKSSGGRRSMAKRI